MNNPMIEKYETLGKTLNALDYLYGDNLGDGIALQILDQNGDEMYTLDCKTEIEAAWDYEAFRNSLNKVIEIEYLDDYYNDQFNNEEDEVIKPGIRITINVGGNFFIKNKDKIMEANYARSN